MAQSSLRHRRTRPAAVARLVLLSHGLLALWSPATLGEVQVQAQVSARELAYGQPVELILTAQGDSVDGPDLSVLEPEFRILDRRSERRVAIRNGQRSAQIRLRLLLLPRRDGTLVVPAIPFGDVRSAPLTLTVAADAGGTAEAQPFPPPVPGLADAPGPAWPDGFPALPMLPPPPVPGAPPVPPIDLSLGQPEDARNGRADRAGASAAPAAPAVPVGTAGNPWFWISLGLAGAIAWLAAGRGRARSSARSAPALGALASGAAPADARAPEPPPASPLDLALGRVRTAYLDADAAAARESLLAWARLRWPGDPPGNLARLAQRCPSPLREGITRLEMAFFSPDPIPWEREPVPQALAELADRTEQAPRVAPRA